jgi:toxin-antitoxin system PIN domain toxin
MRALLDVNVLIALLDAGHVHHAVASRWLGEHLAAGWASCPLTQNGCLRILSTPSYPRHQPVAVVASRLAEAAATPHHEFWADDISVLEAARFAHERWLHSRQITDAYLLALAVRRDGVFVTLDRGIDLRLVPGAAPRHRVTI